MEPPFAPPDLMRVFQVAISTVDIERSLDWYASGLGMLRSGRMDPDRHIAALKARGEAAADGPDVAAIQGIPGAAVHSLAWLVDAQDFFQIELFQYSAPTVARRPAWWQACDIGYSRLGVHIDDFDATLARLVALGTAPLTEPVGKPGKRRVCVLDPDSIVVELMEDDPRSAGFGRARPELGVAVRSVTLSVADLRRSLHFFGDVLGLDCHPPELLHDEAHEALWGLPGACRHAALLSSGDIWIELIEYVDPRGRPRPDGWQLCDQGLLNVALGSRSRENLVSWSARVADAGYALEAENTREFNGCRYATDDQGFSVELYFMDSSMDGRLGLVPDGERQLMEDER